MIVIGDEARDKMLKGINLVADAVKPTLGPMAKTVVLKENGRPIIVNLTIDELDKRFERH